MNNPIQEVLAGYGLKVSNRGYVTKPLVDEAASKLEQYVLEARISEANIARFGTVVDIDGVEYKPTEILQGRLADLKALQAKEANDESI